MDAFSEPMNSAKSKSIPAALLKSLMSAVVDSAMDAIISVDKNQNIILFNPAAERMFQCSQQEALGQKLDRFIPEHHRAAHRGQIEKFGRSGKTTQAMGQLGVLCGLRANNEGFPLEASISQVEVAGKKVFTAILRDVTERHRAEELHSRLAAIVESSNDAIIGSDLQGITTSWNQGAEKLYGYSEKEMVGQSLARLIPPDRREEEDQVLQRTRQGERVAFFDTVRRCKDGRFIDVSLTVSPVRDATGQVVGVSRVARDITELKRAELELRHREAYFRSLIEYASDLITLVDEEGNIHFQSPSIQRVLNLKPEKMTGRNISEFIHPEDLPRFSAIIRRALANPDSPVTIECRLQHQDGAWHLFAAVGRSIPHDFDGKRVVFNSRDITASRNLEEQLLQAQKMEAIGTLTGGIAHDFNNMLAGILGSAELVREDLGPSHPSQEYVESITTAAQRARELVQQILTFSRRRDSEKRVLSLQPVVGECAKLLRSTIPAMVKITHYLEPHCPPVLADPTQIHQVIMNICTNAWHALPETGGHMDISLRSVEVDAALVAQHRELRPGPYVRLAVTDNGHGMDAETRKRIFEPFFTTKPSSKGSGLGLSVVQGIIKSHHGAIHLESEPGKGTTFQVYLPARATNPKETSQPAQAIPHGRGERILFVDDEPIVGRPAEEFLKRLGYEVTRCEQSDEALARFRQTPQDFDLIITDWAMPGMSGTELVSAMQEVRPDIPMLLMSGFVGAAVEKTAKAMGFGEVLIKPVNPELLAQAVDLVLTRAAKDMAMARKSTNPGSRKPS
jgi:two-component system, cell cycle sensor histidine kinase and response regulator CckA